MRSAAAPDSPWSMPTPAVSGDVGASVPLVPDAAISYVPTWLLPRACTSGTLASTQSFSVYNSYLWLTTRARVMVQGENVQKPN
jgi:hypothetical protein